jgi:hypothetical protein
MSNREARGYKLTKFDITLGNDETKDIRDIMVAFKYYESIEAPFTRMEITVVDAVDFNLGLSGGEEVEIHIQTAPAEKGKDGKLKIKMKIYKLGDIVKNERSQMYNLYCCSPEMYNNEINKVFKAFGPGEKMKNAENIPKEICKKYLDAPRNKIKPENFDSHSPCQFVAPSWRPVDVIGYMSNKVTWQGSGKGGSKGGAQSGFLFYENRNGYNFRAIDSLTQQGEKYVYTYIQQGHNAPDSGMYLIESIQYPDKANHLQQMRIGTYKTVTSGVSFAIPTNSAVTDPGSNSKSARKGGSGTVRNAVITRFSSIFGQANTLEKAPPYSAYENEENMAPTRQKLVIIPDINHQSEGEQVDNGTSPQDPVQVASYATARYNLLKAVQLTIKIPGNTEMAVGEIVKLIIPSSQNKNSKRVDKDVRYSGKYLIAGLTHEFGRNGMTSELILVRDSMPKKSNKS